MLFNFSTLLVFVLATVSVHGAPVKSAASSAVTITAPGVAGVPAKPDGCAHITPVDANAQNVCAKSVTAKGFKLTVTDLTTQAKSSCAITGTSGTCGTTGAGATIGAAGAAAPAKAAAGAASPSAVTITAPGVAGVAAKPDGCAHITPVGANAQNVCAKSVTAKGFKLTTTDLTTGAKSSCTITGTSGTCGTTGAGATIGAPAAKAASPAPKAATRAEAAKPNSITITGTGAADVPANHLGCAHVTPKGSAAQLVCTKDFTATGFTISVKDEKTTARTSCVITGTEGTCGPSGAGAKVSNLPKRDVEENSEEIEESEDEDEDEE